MTGTPNSTWSPRTLLIVLLFISALWVLGLIPLAGGNTLGWLPTLLAAWLTIGFAYTAWFHPGTMRR